MLRMPTQPLVCFLLSIVALAWGRSSPSVNVREIIERSVAANQADFKAAPAFDHKERDRTNSGAKTYQITMIDGTPYQRLLRVNGKPLSASENAEEQRKEERERSVRRSQSPAERQQRVAKYDQERRRDNRMMEQLTVAFNFTLEGQHKLKGFNVWVLRATPRPGYQPPNMETQVLPGMEGELWIDQQTYQWVKVTARVVHPVAIEGFLAQVEPGTQFELENEPVSGGTWQPSHFAMKSRAKVLFMINRTSQADETYFDYRPSAH